MTQNETGRHHTGINHSHSAPTPERLNIPPGSLRGRHSKGKGKGIRARDLSPSCAPARTRAPKFPLSLPLLTSATQTQANHWAPLLFLQMVSAEAVRSPQSFLDPCCNVWFAGLKLGILQAAVVKMLDSAIHRINHYPVDKYYGNYYAIHWIVIYPVDSAIQRLNNRDQNCLGLKKCFGLGFQEASCTPHPYLHGIPPPPSTSMLSYVGSSGAQGHKRYLS